MKKFFQNCSLILLLLSSFIFGGIIYAHEEMPDSYSVYEPQNTNFKIFPYYVNETKSQKMIPDSTYSSNIKLLNLFPVKTVSVSAEPKKYVIPCGVPFGAKIYTDGIIVVDNPQKYDNKDFLGIKKSQSEKILQKGDVILKANNQEITSTDEFENIIKNSAGEDIILTVIRKDKKITLTLTPIKNETESGYRAGVWVRDSSAGIGTMTFFDPSTKMFAGLGHGICDIDTGNMLSVFKGTVGKVSIMDVQKSQPGMPGEIHGYFTNEKPIGEIYSNSETGIYGKLYCEAQTNIEPIEIAAKQDVKTGKAQIITAAENNTPKFYDINIDSINYNVNSPTKNIKLTITDPELLEKTGGIVQGMSGSPIIQNEALVGAVTHVLVNNPSKGYGIFAETMLTNSNNIYQTHNKNNE